VQSLRTYVREADNEELRSEVGVGGGELAQIVPDLRRLFPDLPEPPALDSEGARFRLFDAAVDFLRNASQNRPILLFLDDLHAADTPSLLLLRFLARQLGSTRMLVVAAYRDVDPIPGQPLTAMLAEVSREPVTRRLELDGLSEEAVAEYVEETASELASPELTAALLDETEGNPLFLGESVRLLSVEGVRPESAAATVAVPQSVRDVIARRLTHLSDDCNRVLTLGSVLGREFALDVLARFGEMSEHDVLDVLDEAMAARVVAEVPGERGSLRFAHVLIRDTLYEGLTTVRRVQMHRRAVETLEVLYGDDPGAHLAELAHHSIEGSEFDKALRYARRAGDRARALLAYEEAARLYRMALEALDLASVKPEDLRCEVLIALGEAETDAGDGPAARKTFLSAAELARGLDSPEQLARAALGYSGRDLWGPRAEGEPMLVPLLTEALALYPQKDSGLRVKLLARLAGVLRGEAIRESSCSRSGRRWHGRGDRTTSTRRWPTASRW
jgi:predicted ATPase